MRRRHRLACVPGQTVVLLFSTFQRWGWLSRRWDARRNGAHKTSSGLMKILLHNPDNGVTGNFMPHLWMFLLQARTPLGHEVLLLDGNAQPMNDAELVRFVKDRKIDLVGIGAMTRMIARAYRAADALRAAGVKVVMGG